MEELGRGAGGTLDIFELKNETKQEKKRQSSILVCPVTQYRKQLGALDSATYLYLRPGPLA